MKNVARQALVLPLGCASLALLVVGQVSPESNIIHDPQRPWRAHIRTVDEALARRDVSAAVRAWHSASVAVQTSRSWEGWLEAGDAYLRIGEVSGFRKASEPKARQFYLEAFFRARAQRALDGVLRAAEAFAALGDREVAEQCLRTAERFAAEAPRPSEAWRLVDASRRRVAGRTTRAEGADEDPLALLGSPEAPGR